MRKDLKIWTVVIRCPYCGEKHSFNCGNGIKPIIGEVTLPCTNEKIIVEV